MKLWVAGVYVLAGLMELGGIALTLLDLHAIQKRLKAFVTRPRNIFASAVLSGVGSLTVEAVVLGTPPTLEERVDAIENWRKTGLPADLTEREVGVKKTLRTEFQTELSSASNTINDRIDGIQDAIGKPERFWWRGPALLVAGVLVGTVGNLLALFVGGSA